MDLDQKVKCQISVKEFRRFECQMTRKYEFLENTDNFIVKL